MLVLVSSTGNRANAERPIDFNEQIRPILTRHCTSCHGGVKQAGDLSFVYAEQVLPPDGWVIEPGDPDASLLIERIKSDDPDERMPPVQEHPDPLPAEEIELLEEWIRQGAPWGGLWSLQPLKSTMPEGADAAEPDHDAADWARQPLDRLVYQRLAGHGLAPSPEAAGEEWLRRVSFDLIGLPPSMQRVDRFTRALRRADSAAARETLYQRQVDRLLASERFGERWASVWMDLARYADSKGFEKDPHRDMWPYRDWLIGAFNDDMPYDQFTIRQLAGDLLDNPTPDDLIATAFHRNTQTNTEGGTDDEEFRVAALIDRINTTWTVWQATTFGCVQCHSHPYDAFKHEEYYACMAILNDSLDADLASDYPTLKIPADPEKIPTAVDAQRTYQRLRVDRNQLGSDLATDVPWSPLVPRSVSSTEGELRIDGDHVRTAGGTFPPGVRYTVQADGQPLTALRVEILPESDDPVDWPEQGSVLSQFKLSLVKADQTIVPVEIADVFADALTGPEDPRSSLDKKADGVGGYPKLHRPRWAVFVLRHRLTGDDIGPDAMLRLEMVQSNSVTGNLATPIRHFRWDRCDDDAWTELIGSQELAEADRALAQAKKIAGQVRGASLPVMQTRDAAVSRATRQFIRGNWLDRGEEIPPGIPAVFGVEEPVRDRLEFARWLVSDDNPLAARVWANRIWAELFGIGLVETLEDFGSSGTQPFDRNLLDHLAIRLRDGHGWRLKPLLREIVLSSVYRQTSAAPKSLREQDPRNLMLARGPRTRLTAEMIRDQALAVSGLLEDQIGGPSVMPPQPDGVWQTVYSGAQWKTPEGAGKYRRGLYTYWRRTSPYPSFLMFDSPTRDLCSARRIATNTPLQALVTLNDPVYVECGRALAARAVDAAGDAAGAEDAGAAIEWMYRAVTQRTPGRVEIDELKQLYNDLGAEDLGAEDLGAEDLGAEDLGAETPEAPADGSITADAITADAITADAIDADALAIVANTILNLDRAVTK
ncbi:PSD1 and planctomycete cytochrome C domain-containing protein [Stieleria mannarensis]|uniref:PSD1 and planctomycete cytochrome C domain-containing protein n=1 Tax=Stieleria mannarensis TaxID=2755585 RepID=UPI00256FD064|nr:PSD1 and planctomycete cytochrome C domain-containing protein [Rhodopirellula sp. JC639]